MNYIFFSAFSKHVLLEIYNWIGNLRAIWAQNCNLLFLLKKHKASDWLEFNLTIFDFKKIQGTKLNNYIYDPFFWGHIEVWIKKWHFFEHLPPRKIPFDENNRLQLFFKFKKQRLFRRISYCEVLNSYKHWYILNLTNINSFYN